MMLKFWCTRSESQLYDQCKLKYLHHIACDATEATFHSVIFSLLYLSARSRGHMPIMLSSVLRSLCTLPAEPHYGTLYYNIFTSTHHCKCVYIQKHTINLILARMHICTKHIKNISKKRSHLTPQRHAHHHTESTIHNIINVIYFYLYLFLQLLLWSLETTFERCLL